MVATKFSLGRGGGIILVLKRASVLHHGVHQIMQYRLYQGLFYFQNVIQFQGTYINVISFMLIKKVKHLHKVKCHTVSRYIHKCNFIYAHKGSSALTQSYNAGRRDCSPHSNSLERLQFTGPNMASKMAATETHRRHCYFRERWRRRRHEG
jgi:hypothetical protein